MAKYVVLGSGTIGPLVARRLADQGHGVTIVSRHGGPSLPGMATAAVDVNDTPALATLVAGAAAVFNCVNPAYHRWPTDWPPMAASILRAAEVGGADLVTLGNLYVYGRVSGPMSPESPLAASYEKAGIRISMWRDALAANNAGRVRTTEVRASDFIGAKAPGAFVDRVLPRLLVAKGSRVIGSPDAPHSWSYVDDVARTLIAVAQHDGAWGRVWHVPTNPPRSMRQVANDLAAAANVSPVALKPLPSAALRLAGLFSPTIRELPATMYQFESSFVIDDTATRRELGVEPTPWSDVVAATLEAYR